VRICRAGEGRDLPDGGLAMNAGLGIERTIQPDELWVVFGPTVYQSKLRLVAVGEETDGSIVPIEKLSYRPADGWGGGSSSAKDNTFTRDGEERSTVDLAEESVFRMYRVAGQVTGGLAVPGVKTSFEISSIEQYVLREDLIDASAGDDGVRRTHPAFVAGVYYDELADVEGNTKPGTKYPYGFRIDAARQLVLFDRPVYRMKDGGDAPADIYLGTSYHLRFAPGGLLARNTRRRRLGSARRKTGARIEHHPEIFSVFSVAYRESTKVKALRTNREEADGEADYYLDALEREYKQVDRTADVQYAGLVDICPDGAVQQVSWRVGDGGPAVTRASRNTEANFYVPSYAEKRRRERAERDRRITGSLRKALSRLGGLKEAP
jgi:hypothetical protein